MSDIHNCVHRYDDADRALFDWAKVPQLEPTVPILLTHCIRQYGKRTLMVFDDERLTYGEAEQLSAALAIRLLTDGVTKGSRIGLIFPNSPGFVITWLAITRIGAVAVPISTFSTAAELARTLSHADVQLLISADRYLGHDYVSRCADAFPSLANASASGRLRLPEAPYLCAIWIAGTAPPWGKTLSFERAALTPSPADRSFLQQVEKKVLPADPLCIIYTSGSTADPKGVIHGQGGFLRQSAKVAASYPYTSEDRVFTPAPFFWVGGLLLNLLLAMRIGATVLGSKSTAPGALLDFLEREHASYVLCWPHTAKALAADPTFHRRDFSRMRGGSLTEAIPKQFLPPADTKPGNVLGMTETCGPYTVWHLRVAAKFEGSFGTMMPGMELRIVDAASGKDVKDGRIGVILARGDCLMLGLVGRERSEILDEDGWYRTGDLGSFRSRHLYFHGRADDLIKSSGSNVSPEEVAAALTAIAGVAQAHVVGIPDAAAGSMVAAAVVPEPGAKLDVEQLRAAARKTLSSYKVPRLIRIVPAGELPLKSSGKVDRLALAAIFVDAARHRG